MRAVGQSQEAAEREICGMIEEEVAAYEAYMESLHSAMSFVRLGNGGNNDEDLESEE